jgi:hypothetical protein
MLELLYLSLANSAWHETQQDMVILNITKIPNAVVPIHSDIQESALLQLQLWIVQRMV